MCDIDEPGARETAVMAPEGRCCPATVDVTVPDQVTRLIRDVRPQILVNDAGAAATYRRTFRRRGAEIGSALFGSIAWSPTGLLPSASAPRNAPPNRHASPGGCCRRHSAADHGRHSRRSGAGA